jgi:hypothetical protein
MNQEVYTSQSSERDGGKLPGPVKTPFDQSKVLERAPFVALLLVGSVFTLVGVFVSWNAISFRLRSEVAQARVVGTKTAYDSPDAATTRRTASCYPRLEFRDASGTAHEFVGDVSRKDSLGRPGWPIGSTIRIRYEKANPDNARMGGVWSLLRHLFLLLGLGVVALAFKVRSGIQTGRSGT